MAGIFSDKEITLRKTDGGADVANDDKMRKAKSPKFLGLLDGKPLVPVKISQACMCRTFDTLRRRHGNWEDEGHPLKFSLRKMWIESKKKTSRGLIIRSLSPRVPVLGQGSSCEFVAVLSG